MFRRVAFVAALGLIFSASSLAPQAASVNARGTDVVGALLAAQGSAAGYSLPLRNIETGEIVARAVAGPSGEFSYSAVPSGTYVVEAINASGKLMGASAPLVALESKGLTPSMIVLSIAAGSGTQSSLAMSAAAPPVIAQLMYAAMLARIPPVAVALAARRPPSPFK